jgi:hypothetical protein
MYLCRDRCVDPGRLATDQDVQGQVNDRDATLWTGSLRLPPPLIEIRASQNTRGTLPSDHLKVTLRHGSQRLVNVGVVYCPKMAVTTARSLTGNAKIKARMICSLRPTARCSAATELSHVEKALVHFSQSTPSAKGDADQRPTPELLQP